VITVELKTPDGEWNIDGIEDKLKNIITRLPPDEAEKIVTSISRLAKGKNIEKIR